MCGIVGIINLKGRNISKSDLFKMQTAIKHRGPDGAGSFIHQNVGIAMRRLSIIDVSGGNQPLFNEDNTISIVGNGEIYNYIELQKKLMSHGHKFRTGSDIETIIHAYEEWGTSCLNKLRGMFSISIYDIKNGKLIIARDRMGEKPLYYCKANDNLYFSSELKSMISIDKIDKDLDLKSIDMFFHFYYVPEPYTPFKNIKKLRSGSYMVIDLTNFDIKEHTYWDPYNIKETLIGNPTKKIKNELSRACKLTLRSDVPVGVALSGGIDSGSILALAAPKYKETLTAFCIGYDGSPKSDERNMAKKLANKFKVKFIEKEIKTKEVVNSFIRIVWFSDDPVADIAAHSIYEVNKLARDNGVKVLLGGNGGDELFWGYPSTIEGLAKSLSSPSLFERLIKKRGVVFNNPDPITTGKVIESLYTKEFANFVGNQNYKNVIYQGKSTTSGIIKSTLKNLRDLWLKSNVITLGDRMSMAASVEQRSPFLDYKLVELSLSSRMNLRSYRIGNKYYLKKAMENILPNEVLERPKQGFTPPVGNWITSILNKYGHLLDNGFLVKEGILDKRKSNIFVNLSKNVPSYTAYQLLVMEVWCRLYVSKENLL